MANDNLKNALQGAGLTAEEFAEIVSVDPKTVQRWVAGTTIPYPRHRAAIARALDLTEHQLWPADTAPPPAEPAADDHSSTGDVIASWSSVRDPAAPNYLTFVAQAKQRIDVLDSGGQLPQDLIEVLRKRPFDGCEVRVLSCASAENLNSAVGLSGFALRITATRSMPTLFRADEEMLLAIPLSSIQPPALLHLRRHTTDGMFRRIEDEFQLLWDTGEIFSETERSPARQAGPNDATRKSRTSAPISAPVGEDPAGTTTSAVAAETRRWPHRRT